MVFPYTNFMILSSNYPVGIDHYSALTLYFGSPSMTSDSNYIDQTTLVFNRLQGTRWHGGNIWNVVNTVIFHPNYV